MKIFIWIGVCFIFCVVSIGASLLGAGLNNWNNDADKYNESCIVGLIVCIFLLSCIIATIIVFPESFGYMRIVVEEG